MLNFFFIKEIYVINEKNKNPVIFSRISFYRAAPGPHLSQGISKGLHEEKCEINLSSGSLFQRPSLRLWCRKKSRDWARGALLPTPHLLKSFCSQLFPNSDLQSIFKEWMRSQQCIYSWHTCMFTAFPEDAVRLRLVWFTSLHTFYY